MIILISNFQVSGNGETVKQFNSSYLSFAVLYQKACDLEKGQQKLKIPILTAR